MIVVMIITTTIHTYLNNLLVDGLHFLDNFGLNGLFIDDWLDFRFHDLMDSFVDYWSLLNALIFYGGILYCRFELGRLFFVFPLRFLATSYGNNRGGLLTFSIKMRYLISLMER